MGPYPHTFRGLRFIVVCEFFPRYGYPGVLLTDNKAQFVGRHWRMSCERWGMEHRTTPTYHPRANPTERRNQDIKTQLRIRLDEDHTKWDLHLPTLLYCLRRRTNVVTGHSPAELVQGRTLALPGEAQALADTDVTTVDELRDDARRHQELFLARRTPQTTRHPDDSRRALIDLEAVSAHRRWTRDPLCRFHPFRPRGGLGVGSRRLAAVEGGSVSLRSASP
ncbi:uncharacterized protein K02A2.6-like [Bacillus rossius redtenbacheri]|uniref:uncharacterized protein K02A2.6-like n=1 Tax=Bacillus rossius redtenbacheri TaxID=93214 RepID=UPI002FDD5542